MRSGSAATLPASTTSHNVFRMSRDILGSSSTIGAAVTGVIREDDLDAFTGGPEYNLRWR